MLDKNTVRINGWKNNKRTHVDFTVKNVTINFVVDDKVIEKEIPDIPHFSDIAEIGFRMGLDGVTSYNAYNWVGDQRITEKIP